MTDLRARIARLLESVAKDSPTPADVHVDAPMGATPSPWAQRLRRMRRRRGEVVEVLTKLATDPGLYVCRPLTQDSEEQLRAWWRGQPDARWFSIDPDPHVTIVYSKVTVPWTPLTDTVTIEPSDYLGYETLGVDRAVVLRFRSPELRLRWAESKRRGAQWSYPEYKPHMTLFYDNVTTDSVEYRDGAYPQLPPFALRFGPEQAAPITRKCLTDPHLEAAAEAVHDSWVSHCENPEDPHCVDYDQLSEKAKQVDRDAVSAVLDSLRGLGYQILPPKSGAGLA